MDHGQTLARVPIFSGLTESELLFLAQRAVPRHFSTGETVFGEGQPCAGLYVVEEGKRTSEGVEIVMPVSNQELASQIGTVRELVSRNLSRLQGEGTIKIDVRTVIVCNLKALEAELQSEN